MKIIICLLCCLAFQLHADEQVFFAFDDHNIAWQHHQKLTLETAQKHSANPVLRSGPPGIPDHGHAILYGTVMNQEDTFRMWYLGMHEPEIKSGQAPEDAVQPPLKSESWDFGVHFREPVTGFQNILRGKVGEWDEVAILQGHAFVNEGDKTLIWYAHLDSGGVLEDMDIGLATLRRDGFGSLSPKVAENDTHLITDTFEAKETALNVDGSTADAPFTGQLLDHLYHPLDGLASI